MVEFLVHKVHRASRNFYTINEGLLLGLQAWKGGQERGVNIDNLPRELLHKPRREQAHVARQADEVDIVFSERSDDFAIMSFAIDPLRRDDECLQPSLPRSLTAES